ncbi:MAG: TIGR00730 family Rossman fold protein [Rhodospirillales bacterium]|nr:TIGR00730 family Rossman fold protein [Rhodospirillales bacterium]
MSHVNSVAVFCGSRPGHDPVHLAAAAALGAGLAKAGMRLIYGGGGVGLMGEVAAAVTAGGGSVVGVIPDFLMRSEAANREVSELVVTDSMHSRKRRMFDLADAFVCFSGGMGTLDETFEIITWRQLKLHDKPILITDIGGAARPLVALLDAVVTQGFARPDARHLYEVVEGVPATLARLEALATARAAASVRL